MRSLQNYYLVCCFLGRDAI